MKKIAFLLVWLALTLQAHAQTVAGDRFTLNAGPCTTRNGTGSPEGVVTGNVCDIYIRTDSSTSISVVYMKETGTGNTGWQALPPFAAPSTVATIDGGIVRQRAYGQTSYRSDWYTTGSTGAVINSYSTAGSGSYVPLRIDASKLNVYAPTAITGSTTVVGGVNVGDIADPGKGNLYVGGNAQVPTYVSQLIGWRVTNQGEGDFRYLYTDELHAKSFIADLEQALAGGQIIAKSVTKLAVLFVVPSAGNSATLTVQDLPSAQGMAVFESGDLIRLRSFNRSGGSLDISDCWGTVASYADNGDGTQNWTFTRSATIPGRMVASTLIQPEAIVLDYGVSGNGFYEVNAIDGVNSVNSPYAQIVTWSSTPTSFAPTYTLQTRMGNLRGVTGVTGEYGIIAGTYGSTSTGKYIRMSNQAAEIHGVPLKIYNGSTEMIRLSPYASDDVTVNPQLALGNPAPSSFSSGVGCWSGMEAGVFKWRCGDPAGFQISWNGNRLTVNGDITVTGPTLSSAIQMVPAVPGGSGLYIGSDYIGYYDGGTWKSYIAGDGTFRFNGTGSNSISYDGATLTINGNGAGITSINGGNITTGTVTATQIASGTITATQIAAGTITASQIASGTITATQIAASTIDATKMNVSSLSSISANIGSVTSGTLTGVTVVPYSIQGGVSGYIPMDSGVRFNDYAHFYSYITVDGNIYTAFGGSGNRTICTDNSGLLYAHSGACP